MKLLVRMTSLGCAPVIPGWWREDGPCAVGQYITCVCCLLAMALRYGVLLAGCSSRQLAVVVLLHDRQPVWPTLQHLVVCYPIAHPSCECVTPVEVVYPSGLCTRDNSVASENLRVL